MAQKTIHKNQWISIKLNDDNLISSIESFINDKKSQGLKEGSIYFYKMKLQLFAQYCGAQSLEKITDITPNFIRDYLVYLEDTCHNPGGRHAAYRGLKAFLYWWEDEVEPENWKNPIRKVSAPKVDEEPLDPADIDNIERILTTCEKDTLLGFRDRAIFLTLLDTGTRAFEFLAINLEDIDLISGSILIKKGKGGKPRFVYIGKRTKKAIRNYLKLREDQSEVLWVVENSNGTRLTYDGLRSMVTRRSKQIGLEKGILLHSFRRAFAINMLRAGVDIFRLARLMGIKNVRVLYRYLKFVQTDIEVAHVLGSPVDNLKL